MTPSIKVNGSWQSTNNAVQIQPNVPYEVVMYFTMQRPLVEGRHYNFHWDFKAMYSQFTLDTVSLRYRKSNGSDTYHGFTSVSQITKFSDDGQNHNTSVIIRNVTRSYSSDELLIQIRCFMTFTGQTATGATNTYFQIQNSSTYFEDITDTWELEQIQNSINTTNSKLDTTNSKLEEGNQKKQTIIDRLTNLPNALRDMLLGFFVPTSQEFDDFIDDFNDLIYLRLGCVAQTLDFFGDVIDSFIHATAEDQIYIPRLEIWMPISIGGGQIMETHTLTLWQGGYINVMPTEWRFAANNIDYIRTIIDIICLFMLFRYLLNVFYSIVSPEVTESMTLHEILEELEMRTLD